MELRALIIQACNEITEDMCCQVINNITVRVEEAARIMVVILKLDSQRIHLHAVMFLFVC
jgi:ribosomal protein L12E/L44/L45/RPP1/RPP2